jgi:guanine deaminase
MRNILSNIINPLSIDQAVFSPDQVISIDGQQIVAITPLSKFSGQLTDDYSAYLALPGFIDLHVHLSQYKMRGMFEPALLSWLEKHVFPEEARSASEDYAYKLSELFYHALFRAGTTFSVIYTAPFVKACDVAFQVAEQMGIKAMIGMTMMDMNAPQALLQDSSRSFEHSFLLFEKWHGKTQDLDYIFTPRFAPTCSWDLMKITGDFASKQKAWIQTHLSENQAEIAWVKELFGRSSYTEVYFEAGLLTERSILGHAIHLSDGELDTLKVTNAKIAHCPDSNFYLKSGEFPLARIANKGIPFGLGSDVGAGTTLDMLYHGKLMNYRQCLDPVSAANALYYITLGSAQLLGLDNRLGSLAPGKDADIVFFSTPDGFPPSTQSISQLVFFSNDFFVKETLVNGISKYQA